jgi:predicted glycoside hydrolase/deacetylase ChbG (UPF0249 family)
LTTHLIVNADDFGLSDGINAGIVEAHGRGIVTSASLMVRQSGAAAAGAWARAHPALGLGLHIDLWEAAFRDGEWVTLYRWADEDAAAIEREVQAQLEGFRCLVGRDPDHLDTHQHVHSREPVAGIVAALGRSLGVPVRGDGTIHYDGGFYAQDDIGTPYPDCVSVERLLMMIDALPADSTTEFSCHPGRVVSDEPLGGTAYRRERVLELATLCDPRVRGRIAQRGVVLATFADAARAAQSR